MKPTLLSILLLTVMLLIGCRHKLEPLHIACSDAMLPVVTTLGREFHKNFGVPVLTVRCEADAFAFEKLTNYDFVITDDLCLVDLLVEKGTISAVTDFSYAQPVMVFRRSDNLPVLKFADLATVDHPLRLTIASTCETLRQIITTRFTLTNIPLQGDEANIQLLPFLVREIRSDGTEQQTTPETMLQQLHDRKTDIVVFWDFVASRAIANHADSDAFVTIAWPQEATDTMTIPLCLVKDCNEYSNCQVFVNFIKSRRGNELLQSCFLQPCDELAGTW